MILYHLLTHNNQQGKLEIQDTKEDNMKHAVSVSIGSSTRDKKIEIKLLDESIIIERIGTDGDMLKAANIFKELDGKVDAFGVGGADLGIQVDEKYYPLYSVLPMIKHIHKTPFVDGLGLKSTLEHRTAQFLEHKLSDKIQSRRVLFTAGSDRWGMSMGFIDLNYECVFGDLMFALDLPIPIKSASGLKRIASLIMPIVGRMPFSILYPTGEKQNIIKPKHTKWYRWADILAGDCHLIKRSMPDDLSQKIIVTNTTTKDDVNKFQNRGIRYLVTTTPILDGRSFGTNMMEAALVATANKDRKLNTKELNALIGQIGFEPNIIKLN